MWYFNSIFTTHRCICSRHLLKTLWQNETLVIESNNSFCFLLFYSEIFSKLNLRYQPLPTTFRPFVSLCSRRLLELLWQKKKLLSIFIFYGEFAVAWESSELVDLLLRLSKVRKTYFQFPILFWKTLCQSFIIGNFYDRIREPYVQNGQGRYPVLNH